MMATPKTIASKNSNSPLRVVWVFAFILFVNTFWGAYRYSTDSATMDFFTWWAVNHGLSHKYIHMPYDIEEQKILADSIRNEIDTQHTPNVEQKTFEDTLRSYDGRITATATPFYYVAFSRFFSDDYQQDKKRFVGFSIICFALSILILGRLLKFSHLVLLVFYSLVASWLSAYHIELKVGNVNQIQMLLVAAFIYFYAKGKRGYHFALAGLWLGFCILLKPNTCFILLFALLITLLNKEFRKTLALCAGFLLSVLLSFWEVGAYFRTSPLDLWKSWLYTFPVTISGTTFSINSGNYSLSKLIFTYSGMEVSIFLYAVAGGLIVWSLIISRRSNKSILAKVNQDIKEERVLKDVFYAVGFGMLIMILGSRLVWSHYHLLLAVPLILFFLRPQTEANQPSDKHSLISTLTYVALWLSTTMVMKSLPPVACGIVFNVIAVILLVLLVMDAKSSIRSGA